MSNLPELQFPASIFNVENYNNKKTWMNFWYQIDTVLNLRPKTVLEIGPGNQTASDALRKSGIEVTTIDVDPELSPTIVASVDEMPFKEEEFDVVLCSEVLEHLPFEKFQKSLKEIRRVAKKNVIIGLPNAGGVFNLVIKLPFLPQIIFFRKLPFFWKTHKYKSGHYWETGKKNYSVKRIKQIIESEGFIIIKSWINHDDPAHWMAILEKSNN